jgi:dTMP kinase
MFGEAELLLFSASRAQLVREKIRPYLEKGIYVISDRFHDSSTAYQGYGRGVTLETVNNVHNLAIGETIPDLTFFIDIPVGIANERRKKKSKGKLDRIEISDIEFYNRVRSGYLEIARKEERFKVIDGTQTIETIQNQIISELELIDRR